MCTDRLVASAGLKFRRSAFRGEEPRVTLLVPSALGFFKEAIPVDFSINSVTPFYTAALLTECGQIDVRAKALILFVKRWAKDRGICHAAKGTCRHTCGACSPCTSCKLVLKAKARSFPPSNPS